MHLGARVAGGPEFIIAIGNVPPPVSGKTVVTQAVFNELRQQADGNFAIMSPSIDGGRLSGILKKCASHVRGLAAAAHASLRGRAVRAYIVAEGGGGIFLTAIFAWLFSFVANDLIVHHHGALWVSKRSRILRALLFKPGTTHVTQCTTMSEMLLRCYPRVTCLELSNAFLVGAASAPAARGASADGRAFFLCHMSNLTLEKGLGRVIEAFELLKARGQPVALRIGGPPASAAAREVLNRARERHPEIDYVPRVTDAMKPDFFAGMDAFLFPSSYAIETQGIVTLEALAYGIPLIAYPRCCLRETLNDGGGVSVEQDADFAEAASGAVETWINTPEAHAKARSMARARFETLHAESLIEKERLFERLSGALP